MISLDTTFIKRATRVTSFNLTSADFTKNDYKREIQSLYQQYMFGSFDPDMALDKIDILKYNKLVKLLKSDSKDQYEKLHNLSLRGVGPGEAVLFLLTKEGHLGGGSSAGVDLVVGTTKYEVKAVKWKSKATKDYVSDFKLGGNIQGMTQLESEIQKDMFARGYTNSPGAAEIKGSLFQQFEKDDKAAYKVFEARYQKLAKEYFSGHETIFIQTESNQPDFGEIITIKRVKEEDIKMERYTSRSIKPLVRV